MTTSLQTHTELQARRRRKVIEQMLRTGYSDDEICEAAAGATLPSGEPGLSMTRSEVREEMYRIYAQWASEDQERMPYSKSMAVRRLNVHIRKAAAAGKWTAVAAMEKVLGSIQGTIEQPNQITIQTGDRFTEAAIKRLTGMDPAEYRQIIEEQRRILNVTSQSQSTVIPTKN